MAVSAEARAERKRMECDRVVKREFPQYLRIILSLTVIVPSLFQQGRRTGDIVSYCSVCSICDGTVDRE